MRFCVLCSYTRIKVLISRSKQNRRREREGGRGRERNRFVSLSRGGRVSFYINAGAPILHAIPQTRILTSRLRNRDFQAQRASLVRIGCTPGRVLLHSPGECSRFPPNTPLAPENRGYAICKCWNREGASGHLVVWSLYSAGKEIVIYKHGEEIPNLGPTETRALSLHCRLWGPRENKGTDSGTALHPPEHRSGLHYTVYSASHSGDSAFERLLCVLLQRGHVKAVFADLFT
jgi:hypothetical protein